MVFLSTARTEKAREPYRRCSKQLTFLLFYDTFELLLGRSRSIRRNR